MFWNKNVEKRNVLCLEYKADFPEASFDLRSNVTLIGADSVDYEKSLANLEKLKELGARYICAHCFETYKEKPTQVVEDTQDWGLIIMCWCGSEEFYEIDDFVRLNKLNHFKS